jgi:hypothetical protein
LDINVGAESWMKPYYQFCNRISSLWFLRNKQGIAAKLLFVYFIGDRFRPNDAKAKVCPSSEVGWTADLNDMYSHTGWSDTNPLAAHVHKLFVPVCPFYAC